MSVFAAALGEMYCSLAVGNDNEILLFQWKGIVVMIVCETEVN